MRSAKEILKAHKPFALAAAFAVGTLAGAFLVAVLAHLSVFLMGIKFSENGREFAAGMVSIGGPICGVMLASIFSDWLREDGE